MESPKQDQSFELGCEMVRQFINHHDVTNGVTWQQLKDWYPLHQADTPSIERFSVHDWEYFLYDEEADTQLRVFKETGLTRITAYYPITKIKDLSIRLANKLVAVNGTVIGMSELKPDWETVYYKCGNCHRLVYTNKFKQYKPPKKCECGESECFEIKFDDRDSKALDTQVILLQEHALTLSCIQIGKLEEMWKVRPGQRAYALGIIRFEIFHNRQTNKPDFKKTLELLTIEPLEQDDIVITDADKERFKEIVQDPLFYQNVVDSFAPHIHGNEEQKEVCIYTLASQGLLRPNNGLLCGPPAKGKTKLIEYSAKLSHHGTFESFTNVTLAGLTSAAEIDQNTGMRINKPGIFAIYSFVGLTELQAIQEDKKLKLSLNDALERKEVASAKADGRYNIKANFACLIDSNNFAGGWDYTMRLAYNMQFMEPNVGAFMSRMDMTSISTQNSTVEEQKKVAGSNFDTYYEAEDAIEVHREDWTDAETQLPRYGFNTLRKFFYYITHLALPPLDKTLRDYFIDNFVKVTEHDHDFLLDGRYLPTVIRQARIRARMLLKAIADKDDMDEAIRIINKSKNIVVMTEIPGESDANFQLGLPTKKKIAYDLSEEEIFEMALKDVLEKSGKPFFEPKEIVTYIVDELKLKGWTEGKVRTKIQKWTWTMNKLKVYGAEGGDRFAFREV